MQHGHARLGGPVPVRLGHVGVGPLADQRPHVGECGRVVGEGLQVHERAVQIKQQHGRVHRGRVCPCSTPATPSCSSPSRSGPKTLPNRFYQVPHASGFGSQKPRTQAAFRGIKAEGGWGGVCVEYAPVSADADESPHVAAYLRDDRDAAALALTADAVHAHGALAGIELYHGGNSSKNVASRHARIAPSAARPPCGGGPLAREMTRDDIARVQARLRRERPPRARRRLRHRLRVRRARLPAHAVPLDADQPADRRVRRHPRGPRPLRARDARAGARRRRRRLRDRHPHLRRRPATGSRASSSRRCSSSSRWRTRSSTCST